MQSLTQNQTQPQTFPTLEISSDQISTYLSCTLKYQLKYILNHSPEHLRVALPFGDALRKSLGYYYRQCIGRAKSTETSAPTVIYLLPWRK
jgi:hypothetical protein